MSAPAPNPQPSGAVDVVQRFNDAFNRHDVDAVRGHVRGVDIFRVRDGQVAEKLSYVKG